MAILNMVINNKLEHISRELKYAVEIIELYPQKIKFRRQQLPADELSAADLETSKFTIVEYRMEQREGDVVFYRQEGFDAPEELFRVKECNGEIFKGYVLLSGEETSFEGKLHSFPSFKSFDTHTQSSMDVNRIPIVRVGFDINNRKDQVCFITKVFMPIIYSKLVEPDWNAE
jgi:hypothetical protein